MTADFLRESCAVLRWLYWAQNAFMLRTFLKFLSTADENAADRQIWSSVEGLDAITNLAAINTSFPPGREDTSDGGDPSSAVSIPQN